MLYTEFNIDLDQRIIFGLLLTTFEASIIFEAVAKVVKIGSSLKPNHHTNSSTNKLKLS